MFFFFNDTATTEIYTLSLHDALPISERVGADRENRIIAVLALAQMRTQPCEQDAEAKGLCDVVRSEEHTSELQSLRHLVCRLLLEKKKTKKEEVKYTV